MTENHLPDEDIYELMKKKGAVQHSVSAVRRQEKIGYGSFDREKK